MMKGRYQCPSCGVTLVFDPAVVASEVKCPKCAYAGNVSEYKKVPTKKVFCPKCNVGLSILQTQSDVSITCPKCKHTGAAGSFPDTPKPAQDEGESTEMPNSPTQLQSKGKTYKPGKLILETDADKCWNGSKSAEFSLARGKNTLGRRSPNSSASVQFTTTDMYMSRNHAIIDVVMNADATFSHRLSDNGGKNGTFHNEVKLEPGEIINLLPNDTVRLGHTVFKFIVE
jgi:DNA-directed RNA polymerase subunit M/transcription elongation factor TFIIS